MERILSKLERGGVIVADGALGTMLQEAGLPAGMSPEAWLLENPDAVRGVHLAYVEAGSDLILACTFGANQARLERKGLAQRVVEVNRRAVDLAREAADGRAYVAGDVGPLGRFLAPLGPLSYEQAVGMYVEQAQALLEAGVDVIFIETMSAMEEMSAAIEGARQAGVDVPVFASFSFDHHGMTNMGVSPKQAAEKLTALGVAALGANCGATMDMTEGAIAEMHDAVPEAALIAKPNAGIPRTVGRSILYEATPADMAERARRFVSLGARVVGGCCGSTPAHIAAIAAAVRA